MIIENDYTINDFIVLLQNGQSYFKSCCIEDYTFTLEKYIFDNVTFEESFININFKNCSFKNAIFNKCNLKGICFNQCDLTNTIIEESDIDWLVFENCILKNIEWNTNYFQWSSIAFHEFLKSYNDNNIVWM